MPLLGLDKFKVALERYVDESVAFALRDMAKPKGVESVESLIRRAQQLLETREARAHYLVNALFDRASDFSYDDRDQAVPFSELAHALMDADATVETPDDVRARYATWLQTRFDEVEQEGQARLIEVGKAAQRAGVTSPWNLRAHVNDGDEGPGVSWYVQFGAKGASFMVSGGQVFDLLEDEEDFDSLAVAADYRALVSEIQSPGSSQKPEKWLLLYTARPVKDRRRYESGDVPAGIFLANRLDHVEGLARDLGNQETRDIWSLRVSSKDVMETLRGRVKYYQVIRPTKARDPNLLEPGSVSASAKRAAVVRALRAAAAALQAAEDKPFIGPRGGKWADAEHTKPWRAGHARAAEQVARETLMQTRSLKQAKEAADGAGDMEMPTDEGVTTGEEVSRILKSWEPVDDDDDDDLVDVYHATDEETAKQMLEEGVIPALKPLTLAQHRYAAGEDATFGPGAGLSSDIYVGSDPKDVGSYGRALLHMRVPRSRLHVSPEQETLGVKDAIESLKTHDGAIVKQAIHPKRIKRLETK